MPFKHISEYRKRAEYLGYQGHSIAFWQQRNQNIQSETLLFIHGFPSAGAVG